MAMDFNTITTEMEVLAKAKFREYGVGLKMTAYANGDDAKWEDLVNTSLYSLSSIKNKMLEIARKISTTCNDEVLGDLSVAFTITNERDERIRFTWLEMYTFLRAAFKYRKETADYKEKKAKISTLKEFVENNKSAEDKLADATKELATLEAETAE